MTEEDFWSTTPRAFFNAVEGFESLRRADLEIQRLQTLYSINMWAKKPIRDPKKLWSYPWERQYVSDKEKALAQRKARYLTEKIERIEKRHGG
jgi:hypothetical protein